MSFGLYENTNTDDGQHANQVIQIHFLLESVPTNCTVKQIHAIAHKKRISRNEYIRLQCRIFFCVARCLFTIIRRGQPRYKSRLCHSDGKHIMYQVSCSMSGILGVDQPFKKEKKTTADLARRGSVSTGVMRGSCRSFEKKLLKQNLCVKGIIQKIQNSVKPTRKDERIHKMCSVYYRRASSENICSSYYITDVFSARSLRKR